MPLKALSRPCKLAAGVIFASSVSAAAYYGRKGGLPWDRPAAGPKWERVTPIRPPADALPRDWASLSKFIGGNTEGESNHELLKEAIEAFGSKEFYDHLLPYMWQAAGEFADRQEDPSRRLGEMMPNVQGAVSLDQNDCCGLLAAAFFCSYTGRLTDHSRCKGDPLYPSINFDGMYSLNKSEGFETGNLVKKAKLECLLHYFDALRRRQEQQPLKLTFYRGAGRVEDVFRPGVPLGEVVVHKLFDSIDDQTDKLRVDFANSYIGGGVLRGGAVQEEIMMMLHPEMLATRLFNQRMGVGEAILMMGTTRYSTSKGYSRSFRYTGPFADKAPVGADGARETSVVAIDAIKYRRPNPQAAATPSGSEEGGQYGKECTTQELHKANSGFSLRGDSTPHRVATGNWGCGAFAGDPELKALIQWAAASAAGKALDYYPWSDKSIALRLPQVVGRLQGAGVGAGELAAYLTSGELEAGRPVFDQALSKFGCAALPTGSG